MRRMISALSLCAMVTVSLAGDKQTYVEKSVKFDRYFVKLKSEKKEVNSLDKIQRVENLNNKAKSMAQSSQSKLIKTYSSAFNGFLIENTDLDEINELLTDEDVEAIYPDIEIYADSIQYNPPSWGLDRIDQSFLPLNAAFNNQNLDGSNVNVYVFDTGVESGHSDFGGRVVTGEEFQSNAGGGGFGGCGEIGDPPFLCNTASDCNGHGTHVAATIAGSSYGVAKNATIHSLKVLNCEASGSSSALFNAIEWVINNKPDGPAVANFSLGGGQSALTHDSINQLINHGVTVVTSAGNHENGSNFSDDACLQDPASVPNAITVAATNDSDGRWNNNGYSSKVGPCVDLFAPGQDIVSARKGGGSSVKSGTSMSAPHVAGAAALYLQNNPDASSQEVTEALVSTATNGVVSNIQNGSTPNKLLNITQINNSISNFPNIESAYTTCMHNYCINILGENFAPDAHVLVRPSGKLSFSGVYNDQESYDGYEIYSRNPINGSDRLQVVIRDLELQAVMETEPGLCLSVVSNGYESNEQCVVRPATARQGTFMGKVVESYRQDGVHANPEDIQYTSYIAKNNNLLKFFGNTWKKIDYPYTVTADTVLQFSFKSNNQEPEVNGIGFLFNGSENVQQFFQVNGTESMGYQQYHNYSGTDWKTYSIPVGQFFTGTISDMVFAGDADNNAAQRTSFKNPILISNITPDDYDDVVLRGYTDDYEGDAESLSVGQTQTHNFHDAGDQDWTMVWSSVPKTYQFKTQLIGANSDTIAEVYKVTDIAVNQSYPGQNRFIIDDMQLVGSDSSPGSSTVTFNSQAGFLYVMKTKSRTNNFGHGTDYRVSLNAVPIAADQYDNVSTRGYTDDYEGDAQSLSAGQTQIHNFHDNGDKDWTMVWSSSIKTYKLTAEMIGVNSDAKLEVYKVTDVELNSNYPGQNRFIINNWQYVGGSSSAGNSSVTFTSEAGFLYVMKTESRTGSYGAGTEYRSKLNILN